MIDIYPSLLQCKLLFEKSALRQRFYLGQDEAFHLVQGVSAYMTLIIFFANIFPEFKETLW